MLTCAELIAVKWVHMYRNEFELRVTLKIPLRKKMDQIGATLGCCGQRRCWSRAWKVWAEIEKRRTSSSCFVFVMENEGPKSTNKMVAAWKSLLKSDLSGHSAHRSSELSSGWKQLIWTFSKACRNSALGLFKGHQIFLPTPWGTGGLLWTCIIPVIAGIFVICNINKMTVARIVFGAPTTVVTVRAAEVHDIRNGDRYEECDPATHPYVRTSETATSNKERLRGSQF